MWWKGQGTGRGTGSPISIMPIYPVSGLPPTPAAPRLPTTEMPPPLSPPRGLVAVRTPRGVLLHWDPPELVPETLDGYVLEGRQGSQGWEVLDRAVAGTEMQLLVPGLIKVGVEAGTGTFLPSAVQAQLQPPNLSFPPYPSNRSVSEWGWDGWR